MIFIFEGVDRVGKDSVIKGFKNKWLETHPNDFFHEIHCTSLKVDNVEEYSHKYYYDLFECIDLIHNLYLEKGNRHIILNRSHLGECVYGKLYRNYQNPNWVIDTLESDYEKLFKQSYLFLIEGSHKDILKRLKKECQNYDETNESFKLTQEMARFIDVFNQTTIERKIKIDNSRSLEYSINVTYEFIQKDIK